MHKNTLYLAVVKCLCSALLAQGFAPLQIEGEIVKVDTTDFSKLDEDGLVRYTKEVTKELSNI